MPADFGKALGVGQDDGLALGHKTAVEPQRRNCGEIDVVDGGDPCLRRNGKFYGG